MNGQDKPSAANNAVPSAPYILRRPSPPYIHVPPVSLLSDQALKLMPAFENADPTQLSTQDLAIITQNHSQIANTTPGTWSYEQRRSAQSILDYLYLGPNSVARDQEFLKREGITMILVARDSRMITHRLPSVDRAVETLGIEAQYLDVEGPYQLISSFPETIRLINDHLLAVYRSQARGKDQQGQLLVETDKFRRGKVLITCESGNDRSGAVVAAYIMAVFGRDMISALQFISVQRFCCTFDEELKRILQSWEDILVARRTVASQAQSRTTKRGIDDTVDEEDAVEMETSELDRERFTGRHAFVPFTDMA